MKYPHIAQAVKSQRKSLGINQPTLAKLSGASLHTVCNIEKGREVKLDSLVKVLDTLGLELDIKLRRTD